MGFENRRAAGRQVDRAICLATPGDLIWHGIYYPQRGEVSDDDIGRLLEQEAATALRTDVHGPRTKPPRYPSA